MGKIVRYINDDNHKQIYNGNIVKDKNSNYILYKEGDKAVAFYTRINEEELKEAVPYPDFDARKKLVELYCKNKSFSGDCSPELLAKEFDGYSCAKIESILNRASLIASQKNKKEFNMEDVRKACKEV